MKKRTDTRANLLRKIESAMSRSRLRNTIVGEDAPFEPWLGGEGGANASYPAWLDGMEAAVRPTDSLYDSNFPRFRAARLLIIEEERGAREMLVQALEAAGHRCRGSSLARASRILRSCDTDVVIMDGAAVSAGDGQGINSLVRRRSGADVILMVCEGDEPLMRLAMKVGALDCVRKPVGVDELLVRLERLLRERAVLAQRDRALERLHDVHQELREAYLDSINRLVLASEYRDDDTGDHIVRMGRSSAFLAERLGMPAAEVRCLRYAAPMHDVGKIGIPDRVLLKPRRLTQGEVATMRAHTLIGARLLAHSKSEIIQLGQQIALTHHENWDGSGYPVGTAAEQIPLAGRIVRLVDVFDALTSSRPYKDAYPLEVALRIIAKGRGSHFDPEICDVFLANVDALVRIKAEAAVDDGRLPRTFAFSQRDHDDNPDISQVP